jgi:hypothetical protein
MRAMPFITGNWAAFAAIVEKLVLPHIETGLARMQSDDVGSHEKACLVVIVTATALVHHEAGERLLNLRRTRSLPLLQKSHQLFLTNFDTYHRLVVDVVGCDIFLMHFHTDSLNLGDLTSLFRYSAEVFQRQTYIYENINEGRISMELMGPIMQVNLFVECDCHNR